MNIGQLHNGDYIQIDFTRGGKEFNKGHVVKINKREKTLFIKLEHLQDLPPMKISIENVVKILAPKTFYRAIIYYSCDGDMWENDFNTLKEAKAFIKERLTDIFKDTNIKGFDITKRDRESQKVLEDIDYYFKD